MNKKSIIIVSLVVLGLGYLYTTSKPNIYTIERDNLKKTAIISINGKQVVYDGKLAVMVGKVSLLYDAQIIPIENGFQVNILQGSKIKYQDTFYFD